MTDIKLVGELETVLRKLDLWDRSIIADRLKSAYNEGRDQNVENNRMREGLQRIANYTKGSVLPGVRLINKRANHALTGVKP